MSNTRTGIGNDFRVINKLGEGSFAEVFKVKAVNTNAIYAIKRLKKRYRSVAEVNSLPEIVSLQTLQGHPNIVTLIDVMFDSANGYVAMVFEMMDCNLYEYVKDKRKALDEQTALLFTYQLLKAVSYMHSKSIFHRDIKPENCMVNSSTQELKLVDFGSTRTDTNPYPYTEYVSTRWYRAPECILTSGSYGREVDIWAIGCMLYELMTTRPLFPGKHEIDQIARIHNVVGSPSKDILSQFRENPNTQISFSFPSRKPQDMRRLLPAASEKCVDLLKSMLIYDPRERITAQQAIDHPVFAEFRRIDSLWENAGRPRPFPVYFKQQMSGAPQAAARPVQDEQKPKFQPPNPALLQQDQNKMQPVYKPAQPLQKPQHAQHAQGFQPPNAEIIQEQQKQIQNNGFVSNYYQIQQKQKPIHAPIIAPKPPPAKQIAAVDLQESRRKAIQRIREYNQKKLANQINQAKVVYQKPAPEIVQPRLPKLKPFR